ncbi:MerR family transcriptional regulator [Furfurilactobacillus entadae]|uniref:MerR family transcriptional regulator n=1 Tax=Furfurilactobacillus entadae TaxID=2922307 RepID=UPI0035F0BFE3
MNIKEASEQTGVPATAIRYYESESLIPPIDRTPAGNRDIDERILRRIKFVTQMRAAGMTIENLRKYINLFDSAAETSEEERALLTAQLVEMEQKRDDLQTAIDHLHDKLDHFDEHMQETRLELHAMDREHEMKQ